MLRGFGLVVFAGGVAVNGVFVSGLGFRFREITSFGMDGFVFFLLGLLVGDFHFSGGANLLGMFFRFFFGVVLFFEFGAAYEGIGFRFGLGFFMLGFHEARGKGHGFFIA